MRQQRRSIVLISIIVVAVFLATDVIHAFAGQPQPGTSNYLDKVKGVPVGEGEPASQTALAQATQNSPAAAEAGITPLATDVDVFAHAEATDGRLLFAPAIDADGNPTSNPTRSNPVPVIELLGEPGGLVELAIQLVGTEAGERPAPVPVTFRVWTEDGFVHERSVDSDEWGTAQLDVPLRYADAVFHYQAAAPGFGTTEIRQFTLNRDDVSIRVHHDGGQLAYELLPGNWLKVQVTSPLPLNPDTDIVTLTLFRRPLAASIEAIYAEVSQHMPEYDTIDKVSAEIPPMQLPKVILDVQDSHTAEALIQLPAGDYGLQSTLIIDSEATEYFNTNSENVVLNDAIPLEQKPAEAAGISDFPYEPGKYLVTYEGEVGRARFDIAHEDALPPLVDGWVDSEELVNIWRTGPYEWYEETYQVEIESIVDDGKKEVILQEFTFDPLEQAYTIAIRSKHSEVITDMLRIDVYGPGDIVILHEDNEVVLQPDEILYHTIKVPASLGRPQGLRVTLDDPLIEDIKAAASALRTLYDAASVDGSANAYVQAYIDVLSITLIQATMDLPGGALEIETPLIDQMLSDPWGTFIRLVDGFLGGINFLNIHWGTFLRNIFFGRYSGLEWDQLLAEIDNLVTVLSVELGAGGVAIGEEASVSFSVDEGACPDPAALQQIEENLQRLAITLNSRLSRELVNTGLTLSRKKVPIYGPIALTGIRLQIRSSGEIQKGSGLSIDLQGQADIGLQTRVLFTPDFGFISVLQSIFDFNVGNSDLQTIGWFVLASKFRSFTQFILSISDYIQIIKAASNIAAGQDDCDPDPPDRRPPDDRQDIWQGVNGFFEATTEAQTINNLHESIQRAQQLGLTRAERLLTLRLREIEQKQFVYDTRLYLDYMDGSFEAMRAADQDIVNIISGTVQLSSTVAISQAITSRMFQASAEMEALEYVQTQDRVATAVDAADQEFQELLGEELALQQELRQLYTADLVGVSATGFAEASLHVLKTAGLPSQLVSLWPGGRRFRAQIAPYMAPNLAPRVLVIPSGGLHIIASSPEARAWLEAYVAGGGQLIVFSQAFGADYAALPGGEVNAVGYEEEQRWQWASVEPGLPSKWLVWVDREQPSIQVDGAFTAWPDNADLLLYRTKGAFAGYPALIDYPYGDGHVIAMTAYGDWAGLAGFSWVLDWAMVRTTLIRAFLLARGQDVEDLVSAPPGGDFTLSVPLTNTSSDTVTSVRARVYSNITFPESTFVPVTIPPGESADVLITMPTIPFEFDLGMFRTQLTLNTERRSYNVPGPFFLVDAALPPDDLITTLTADTESANLFQTVAVTATVENVLTTTSRTIVIEGSDDLASQPITLTVPPGETVLQNFEVRMDGSKELGALFYEDGELHSVRYSIVNVRFPDLTALPELPPLIETGAPLTLTVNNVGQDSVGAASNASTTVTLVSPTGAPVWTETQVLPLLAPGESMVVDYTFDLPQPTEIGIYALQYQVDDGRALSGVSGLPVFAQPAVTIQLDADSYRLRDNLTVDVSMDNNGRFALDPVMTLAIPDLGVAISETVSLPVGASYAQSFDITLPDSLSYGAFPIDVVLSQGNHLTHTTSFFIPEADLAGGLALGPYNAGTDIPVTISNTGGVDTTLNYTMTLLSRSNTQAADELSLAAATVSAGGSAVITGGVPLTMPTGTYWLRLTGTHAAGEQYFYMLKEVLISGSDVEAVSAFGPYSAGSDIDVSLINHGNVGAYVTYTLSLQDNNSALPLPGGERVFVPGNATTVVTATVPAGARSGQYGLHVDGFYTPGDRPVRLVQLVNILGTELDITAFTDRELYLTVDTITNTGIVTNGGTPLPGADLDLSIIREVPGRVQAWAVYQEGNSALVNNTVTAVASDSENNVWLGSIDSAEGAPNLQRLLADLETWETHALPITLTAAYQINALVVDPAGQLWVATNDGVAVLAADLGDWSTYQTADSPLVSDYVRSLAVDSAGTVWLGTLAGVSRLAAGGTWTTFTSGNSGLPADNIYAVATDGAGNAWFGTSSGLAQLATDGTWTVYDTTNSDLLSDEVADMVLAANGDLWLATPGFGAGVSVLTSAGGWLTYTVANSGLASPNVYDIEIDAEGRKWIGSDGAGLDILSAGNNQWQHVYRSPLGSNTILDIVASANGDVWLGTQESPIDSGGATRGHWSDLGFRTYHTENSFLSWNEVTAVETDNSDNVWLASRDPNYNVNRPSLDYLIPGSDGWNSFELPYIQEGLSNIFEIYSDANGRTWLATNDGVAMLSADQTTWTIYQTFDGLANNYVRGVTVDEAGNAWFATNGGISYLAVDGTWTTYNQANSGLETNYIYSIAIDQEGTVWAATLQGLSQRLPDGSWTTFSTANSDIAYNNVHDVAVDAAGNVWLAIPRYNAGVSVLHPDGTWTTYNINNSGLTTNYVYSLEVDAGDRKWFGTNSNGVDVLSADNMTWFNATAPAPLGGDGINDIAAAANGDVWLALEATPSGEEVPPPIDCEFPDACFVVGGATRAFTALDTEDILWQHIVPITLGSPDSLTEVASLAADTLGVTGRLTLRGVVTSTLGQQLAIDRDPFYIFPTAVGLTVDTDAAAYQTGQAMQISGALVNDSAQTLFNQTISVRLNGEERFFAGPFDLPAGQTYPYSLTTPAPATGGAVRIDALSPLVSSQATVDVYAPRGIADLAAPEYAGRDPFPAVVTVHNTGERDALVEVTIAGTASEWLLLAPGSSQIVIRDLTIIEDTIVTATVRGDLDFDLEQLVLWGEAAALTLLPPSAIVSGLVAVPYRIDGTGLVATPVEALFELDGTDVYSRSALVRPGQTLSGSLPLNVGPGRHLATGDLYDLDGRLLDQDEQPLTLSSANGPLEPRLRLVDVTPAPLPVAAGDRVSVTLTVANDGPAGPGLIGLQLFDPLQQWVITPDGWTTTAYTFSLDIPADTPADDYFGEASLDREAQPFVVPVVGLDVDMTLALDQPFYYRGDPAQLTVTLTDTSGLTGEYLIISRYLSAENYFTVTVPANQSIQHIFNFTATETSRTNVFLSNVPSPENGQRILMLDSLPVPVIDTSGGAWLTFDKLIYDPGETVHMNVHITGTIGNARLIGPMELTLIEEDTLFWGAPNDPAGLGLVLSGTYPVSYTLPAGLRMGQYTFMLQVDGDFQPYPIDVRGWKITTRHVSVDKTHYDQQDVMTATVEFWNEGETPVIGLQLKPWIFTPDGGQVFALGPLGRTIDLAVGLNVVTVTGVLSTPVTGPHRLAVNLTAPGHGRVTGGATQFDVGWAHLVELTTDQGIYTPGETGTGRLDVYGFGPTQLDVIASDGTTLLDTTAALTGFTTYTFTIPTSVEGDYLLVANSIDQNGGEDELITPYAVPTPRDNQPPTITLTYPAGPTIIVSDMPTTTIDITGFAHDDSGDVTALVNGEVVSTTSAGLFTTTRQLVQGINLFSATALDPDGNVAYTPIIPVRVIPTHQATLAVDQPVPQVGNVLTYTLHLTAAGTLSNVQSTLLMPTAMVTDVIVTSNLGQVTLDADAEATIAQWQGDVINGLPIFINVTLIPLLAGELTAVNDVFWGMGIVETLTETVIILPASSPPQVVPDLATTDEDVSATIDVLANDSDSDNDPLSVISVTVPLQGAAVINVDNTVTYTPSLNYNGSDSFYYVVSDGTFISAPTIVSLTVNAVNDAPQLLADVVTLSGTDPISIDVLANDGDVDGDSLEITAVTQPLSGTVAVTPAATVVYTPSGSLSAADSFTYTVSDGQGGVGSALVTVNPPPAQAPSVNLGDYVVLASNSVWLNRDGQVHSGDIGVLNASPGPVLDSEAEVSLGTSVIFHNPTSDIVADTVALNSGSSVFTIFHNELNLSGNPATGPLITPLALPLAVDLPLFLEAVPGDTEITVAHNQSELLAAGDYGMVTLKKNSILTLTGGIYHLSGLEVGFNAQVRATAPSQIRISNRLQTFPFAQIVPADGSGVDATTFTIYVAGINGTTGEPKSQPTAVRIGPDNVMTASVYAPNGTIWLLNRTVGRGAFLAHDVLLDATVQVSLESAFGPVDNVNPTALPDAVSLVENTAVTLTPLSNDVDVDEDPLTLVALTAPANGTTVVNPDNSITYTPTPGFSGNDSLVYTLSDGRGGSDTAVVTFEVIAALGQFDLADFVLLGTEGIFIDQGSIVYSGHIGVNQASAGPYLAGNEALFIGLGSQLLSGESWTLADSVGIAEQAGVHNLAANELSNDGAIHGQLETALSLPLVAVLPLLPTITAGTDAIAIPANETVTVAAGSYDLLNADNGATLIFTGGVYHFSAWQLGNRVKLYFQAPSSIRIAGGLQSGADVYLGPDPSATALTAADIELSVAGENELGGNIYEDATVHFGLLNTIRATVQVPHGTLLIDRGSAGQGAFLAKWIILGVNTAVTLERGW